MSHLFPVPSLLFNNVYIQKNIRYKQVFGFGVTEDKHNVFKLIFIKSQFPVTCPFVFYMIFRNYEIRNLNCRCLYIVLMGGKHGRSVSLT